MPTLFTTPAPQTLTIQSHTIAYTTHVWVSSNTALTAEQTATLCALLDAQPNAVPSNATLCVVSARCGTLSPWSSKAADIAAQCGVVGIRLEQVKAYDFSGVPASKRPALQAALYDRMTQSVHSSVVASVAVLGQEHGTGAQVESFSTAQDTLIPLLTQGKAALTAINTQLGLALSAVEIDYLFTHYTAIKRDPTDAELMMFAQANSEHCRHKIFNAAYTVDGAVQKLSMFGHIRTTHAHTPQGTVVAYSDNAAVIGTATVERFRPIASGKNIGKYTASTGTAHGVLKAETHNHPTAISPYAGAATGAGGEIRDEGATGRGATPRAGFTGFSTSLLNAKTPSHLATPNQIMIDGPLGAAAFNNEFGRPALGGYWRAYESSANNTAWGYHKPIMMAGGWGTIDAQHAKKQAVRAGDYLIQLGGPGLRIGIGGGAASSMAAGQNDAALDFNSVQRDNAEMQRRAQMVINACMALGGPGEDRNPIRSIHDVGAGGLSNAFPEIVDADGLGAKLALEAIPLGESGLSALEAWCNESQERYVLAIAPEDWVRFETLCQRERCPVAHVGVATKKKQFQVTRKGTAPVVDWEMHALLGKMDKLQRSVTSNTMPVGTVSPSPTGEGRGEGSRDASMSLLTPSSQPFSHGEKDSIPASWQALCEQTLAHPTVASKRFLITIGDRTVGGYSHRDPMVGPWQEPVADCAVTMLDYAGTQAEAASMGERTPLAIYNAPASGRMAVAEALSNLAAAPVATLDSIKLSCNWMAAASQPEQDAALYATVDATASFCRDMDLGVPVGKDSLSMQVNSPDGTVTSPVSLVVTAYAPLPNIAAKGKDAVLTPLLQRGNTVLMVLKANTHTRLAGSMAQQLFADIMTQVTPDVTSVEMRNWLTALQAIRAKGMALAYHDVSDGGLWATLCEMAFATRCGLNIDVQPALQSLNMTDAKVVLFNEEVAAVVQIAAADAAEFTAIAQTNGVVAFEIGEPVERQLISVMCDFSLLYAQNLTALHAKWDSVSASFTAQRDKTEVVAQESARITATDYQKPHLHMHLTFAHTPSLSVNNFDERATAFLHETSRTVITSNRPKVAILREQGVNSMVEMAYAWTAAGFDAYDVTMTDLIAGRVELKDFQALVACGGFSYGDVLGAGLGWARGILQNPLLRDQFQTFFHRPETLALGVCNGCQMMSYLDELMPNDTRFPRFVHNASGRYEARVSMLEVQASPSVFLQGMAGTRLPVAVAHGEGRMQGLQDSEKAGTAVAMRFVDGKGQATETYPMNPNGSPQGATGVCSGDGRVTLMMPHPERVFRYAQWSWLPEGADIATHSPWMQLFHNAYSWCVRHG